MSRVKTITISTSELQTHEELISFEKVLKIIKKEYDESDIEFLGWLDGNYKVISIDGEQFKVISRQANYGQEIVLRETRAKNIKIPTYPQKQLASEKYRKVLE